jgi:hypothetical protein
MLSMAAHCAQQQVSSAGPCTNGKVKYFQDRQCRADGFGYLESNPGRLLLK